MKVTNDRAPSCIHAGGAAELAARLAEHGDGWTEPVKAEVKAKGSPPPAGAGGSGAIPKAQPAAAVAPRPVALEGRVSALERVGGREGVRARALERVRLPLPGSPPHLIRSRTFIHPSYKSRG
jgi:hypothetical protein